MGHQRFNLVMDWLMAVIVATLFTCWAHSWAVQAGLRALGVEFPPGAGFRAMMRDAFGMGPSIAAVYAIALAIAFGLVALVRRRFRVPMSIGYALGGMFAIAATLLTMKAAMDITPIAGARNPLALTSMIIGGGVAGLVFAMFRPKTA